MTDNNNAVKKSRVRRSIPILLLLGPLLSIGLVFLLAPQTTALENHPVEIQMTAFQFGYSPSTITVAYGEKVKLVIEAKDSVHGFYLEGYNIMVPDIVPGQPVTVQFTANQLGTFRFRCATVCGALHPFMIGILKVEPNYRFLGSALTAIGLSGASVAILWISGLSNPVPRLGWKFDVFRIPLLKRIVRIRSLQSVLMLPNLLVFVMIILTGLIGVPLGAKNLSIVFTWILWWVALMVLIVPFFGRAWCFMCPIVLPGEPIQRRFWQKTGKPFTLGKKWPKALSNMWPQNILFMLTSLWIVVLVTQPLATAIMVLALIFGALLIFLVFERRTWCRYLCPVSGFIGLYSMFSSLELRVKDPKVCLNHMGKDCFKGNACGFGCPWNEFPQNLDRNTYCGLCMECVKTCPENNIAINLRPFAQDLLVSRKRRLDEAWKALMMLSLALLYSLVLMGPWSWLKDWGNYWGAPVGIAQHVFYIGLILGIVFGLFPLIHLLVSVLSRALSGSKTVSVRKVFVDYAYAYIPLGLMLWIGFSAVLILINWAYIPVVASDPFGFGWNLLGTRDVAWSPISWPVPIMQAALSLVGLRLSLSSAYNISTQTYGDAKLARRAMVPLAGFLTLVTIAFLWMFV